ncbi:MAG: hypothetical protein ACI4OZ_00585 [Akkermansia sp.]
MELDGLSTPSTLTVPCVEVSEVEPSSFNTGRVRVVVEVVDVPARVAVEESGRVVEVVVSSVVESSRTSSAMGSEEVSSVGVVMTREEEELSGAEEVRE